MKMANKMINSNVTHLRILMVMGYNTATRRRQNNQELSNPKE